jgi:hypothetical protein
LHIVILKLITTILFLLFTNFVFAQQNKSVKLIIVDDFTKPIENVLAIVYFKKDSSIASSFFSDIKGIVKFTINVKDSFFLKLTKDSFLTQNYFINQPLPDTVFLHKLYKSKDEIIVNGSPIIIKEDTIQFNNELFKKDSTKTLEEVLKKLPGVTIDREGNIEINGQKITEILLDGKPSPFTDIKTFTQIIQAGLIDKIQFIDKKSDETKISKIDNGQRNKVIDIKLKSKTKKSYNQTVYMGLGNKDRLETSFTGNYIYNDVNIIGTSNYSNTGQNGFGSVTYFNPTGISKGFSSSIGGRYTGSKKWNIGGNVTYNNQNTLLEEQKDRVVFLKDSLNYFNQMLTNITDAKSIRFTSNITFNPDTLGEFKLNTNVNTSLGSVDRGELFSTQNNSKLLTNKGSRNNDGNNNRTSFDVNITGGRRTKNDKASFYTNLNFGIGNNMDIAFQQNNIIFYRNTGLGYYTTKQKINNANNSKTLKLTINGYKAIYKNLKLQIGVGMNYTNRPTSRNALGYNYVTNQYEIPNSILNNNNINLTNILTQSLGIVYTYKKHTFTSTLNYNQQINKNIDQIRDTTILQNNTFFTPSFYHNYSNKKLYIYNNITISQRNPTSQELQPIVDNSNPLFIRKGNPNLKNQQSIYLSSSINKRPSKSPISYNISNNITITKNKIANNTFFDAAEGKQTSIPINLPEVFNLNSTFSLNKYIEKHKLNVNTRLNITYNKDNNFLNGELNKLTNLSLRPNFSIKINKKKYSADYAIGYLYQTNNYSLRPTQNIKIGNFTTDAAINLSFIKQTEISFTYQQTINNNKRTIQKINNLNGKIAYNLKWKYKTTIALSAYDILNQNSNLRQIINDYYEEFVTTNAIRRFVLLSVLVKFNKFTKGKK